MGGRADACPRKKNHQKKKIKKKKPRRRWRKKKRNSALRFYPVVFFWFFFFFYGSGGGRSGRRTGRTRCPQLRWLRFTGFGWARPDLLPRLLLFFWFFSVSSLYRVLPETRNTKNIDKARLSWLQQLQGLWRNSVVFFFKETTIFDATSAMVLLIASSPDRAGVVRVRSAVSDFLESFPSKLRNSID